MANKDKKKDKAAKANLANKNKEALEKAAATAAAPAEAPVEAPVETAKVETPAAPVEQPQVENPEEKKEEAPMPPVEDAPAPEKKEEAPKPAPAPAKTHESKKEKATKAAAEAAAKAAAEKKENAPVIESPAEEVSIEPIYTKLAGVTGNDRFSHSDALKLGEMFKAEFADDPEATKEQQAYAKQQYRGVLLNEMLFYSAQVANDFQTLGVKVSDRMFLAVEAQAREFYGITLVGLPVPGHPDQKMIDFGKSNVPEEVKEAIVKDEKARKEIYEIPAADPSLPEDKKLEIVRAIFSQKLGRGVNLVNGLNWAKDAFELKDNNKGQILAVLFDKFGGSDPTLLSGTTNAIIGKFFNEHTITSAHALLKLWAPAFPDKDIADMTKVFMSRGIEKKIADFNRVHANDDKKLSAENEFTLMNRRIRMGMSPEVITGIIAKSETVMSKDEDGKDDTLINGLKCFNSLLSAYGESESIAKDKLAEIVKYYGKPIDRLAAYVDKSAYAE